MVEDGAAQAASGKVPAADQLQRLLESYAAQWQAALQGSLQQFAVQVQVGLSQQIGAAIQAAMAPASTGLDQERDRMHAELRKSRDAIVDALREMVSTSMAQVVEQVRTELPKAAQVSVRPQGSVKQEPEGWTENAR